MQVPESEEIYEAQYVKEAVYHKGENVGLCLEITLEWQPYQ